MTISFQDNDVSSSNHLGAQLGIAPCNKMKITIWGSLVVPSSSTYVCMTSVGASNTSPSKTIRPSFRSKTPYVVASSPVKAVAIKAEFASQLTRIETMRPKNPPATASSNTVATIRHQRCRCRSSNLLLKSLSFITRSRPIRCPASRPSNCQ